VIEAMFLDGVLEMMNIAGFTSWLAKAKNGGIDAQDAAARFEAELLKPGAITDTDGPTPKLARRVAVKVKDLVIYRNGTERSRISNEHP
jgi:hypothetical protein